MPNLQRSSGSRCLTGLVSLLFLLATGCSSESYLAIAPNLYTAEGAANPFEHVAEAFRTSDVRLLYATDRAAETDKDGRRQFGFGRSNSLEIGFVTVAMGDNLSWDELVASSRSSKRETDIVTRVKDVTMLGRFPESNLPPIMTNGVPTERPEVIEGNAQAVAHIHNKIREYIAPAKRKEIFLFVHGYNNTFDAAAIRMATLWHFLGREGVPVIYSWPAGSGGLLRGYNRDRESGEFTIYHFKQFLSALASSPDVEKIHIVAHSRGTDVTVTTLRELNLEFKHLKPATRERLKIGHLILAAPDLDFEVFNQRALAERLGTLPESVTVYVSQGDQAISLADWLFQSGQRLGTLMSSAVKPEWQETLRHMSGAAIVDVKASTIGMGHAYFVDSPEALSDVILVLRDGRDPGAANGRPLHQGKEGFWELHNGYPNAKPESK